MALIDCNNIAISDSEILNSLLVRKISTGEVGLRVKNISADDADIEPVIGCAEINLDGNQILRMAIGLTATDQPAILLIEET